MTKQDESTQDTQEQASAEVKGHVLTNEQMHEWGNEGTLELPGLIDEQGKSRRDNENNEDEETDDTSNDDETQDDEELPEPEALDTSGGLEDPGDFVPANYSFSVTVYTGEEGKEKAKTVTIRSVEDAERLLEEDPSFGSSKGFVDFNRKVMRLESNLERDEREHKALKDAYDDQQKGIEAQQERVNTIANEIEYLVSKEKLPKIADKYKNANWADSAVAKQPGVKEQLALIKYMNKENIERRKLGLSPMGALDAYNQMQAEVSDKRKAENRVTSAEARKQAGGRVSGVNPAPVGAGAPKGIAVGRGGSLRDLGLGQW